MKETQCAEYIHPEPPPYSSWRLTLGVQMTLSALALVGPAWKYIGHPQVTAKHSRGPIRLGTHVSKLLPTPKEQLSATAQARG